MANNSPAETYRLAYKEALQETQRAQSLVDKLEAIAGLVQGNGWKNVGLTSGSQTFYRPGLNPRNSPGVSLSELPTAEQIHKAISDWGRTRDHLERLYMALPADDQTTVPDFRKLEG
jgi:hypothetical protein